MIRCVEARQEARRDTDAVRGWVAEDRTPREYAVPASGEWPFCRVSGPPWAHVAAHIAREIRSAQRDGRVGERGSLRAAARQAGIAPSIMSRMVKGDAWPSSLHVHRVCLALGIDPYAPEALSSAEADQLLEDFAAFVGAPYAINTTLRTTPEIESATGLKHLAADFALMGPDGLIVVEMKSFVTPEHANAAFAERVVTHLQGIATAVDAVALRAVLTPTQAPEAFAYTLGQQGIAMIYRDGEDFRDSTDGRVLAQLRAAASGRAPDT